MAYLGAHQPKLVFGGQPSPLQVHYAMSMRRWYPHWQSTQESASGTGVESFCIPDERDRLNPALSAGYSNGWFRTDGVILPVDLRNQVNGNSFSGDSIWQFIKGFQPRSRVFATLMTADDIYAAAPEAIEVYFLQMVGDPLTNARKWCKAFAQKYGEMISPTRMKMPDLGLKQNTHETIVHRAACPGDVPSTLAASADYAIDELIRETSHKKANYHPSYWIRLLFFLETERQTGGSSARWQPLQERRCPGEPVTSGRRQISQRSNCRPPTTTVG